MTLRARSFSFTVTALDEGRRLDQVLALRVPGLSRRRARVLIDLGGVFVDGHRVKMAGRPLRAGERVVAHLGGALERATKEVGHAARARDEAALPMPVVVHEDEHIVVVDKPAGLLTAPTPESDRNNLASVLARGGRAAVFVVHRIDLDTSGLLVLAKTAEANRVLSERFRCHDLVREYLAVVAGKVPDELTVIETPIRGKTARTRIAIEERLGVEATLVRATLDTGRTHQIRIHFRDVGHPVLGDRQYGTRTELDPPRLALHAARLALPHPHTGASLDFRSSWPADLGSWLEGLQARTS